MLLVNEIYPALCGESRFSGTPCALIRLTGCHLRCSWCDSAHAFAGGERLSVDQILARVADLGLRLVLVTGGEPLLQPQVVPLLQGLLAAGRNVLLETSGARGHDNLVGLAEVPAGVRRIVDLKAPGSGIPPDLIDWAGIAGLGDRDELKVVCLDRSDYEWARDLVLNGDPVRDGRRLPRGVRIAFSPVHGELEPRLLAEWILADRLDVVLQLQLHKVIWPERERGV